MPPVEQSLDLLLAATELHLAVGEARLMIARRVFVGVAAQAAHHTAERLLRGAIGVRDVLTARARLRGIGRLPSAGRLPALAPSPGQLLRQLAEVAGGEIGVHPPRLEAHRANRQLL